MGDAGLTTKESSRISKNKYNALPERVLKEIAKQVSSHNDLLSLMLLCKGWSKDITEQAYHAPELNGADSFERLMGLLNTPLPAHPYPKIIRELDISGLAADNLYMGDLNAALSMCPNIEIFRLENCYHISNMLVRSIADYCQNIKQVDLPGCPVTDTFIPLLTKNCKKLESLDLSFSNVTISSLFVIIENCEVLLHVDLTECHPIEKDSKDLDLSFKGYSRPLRLLNLRNTRISDDFLKFVVAHCQGLENVILDSCPDISDDSIMKLAQKSAKLRRLDFSFSDRITDKTLQSLAIRAAASNGGALEQLYLSACDLITAPAVQQLAQKSTKLQVLVLDGCERILETFIKEYASRRGDLECSLEGESIRQMAAHVAGAIPSSPVASPERKKEDGELKVEVEYMPKNVDFVGVLANNGRMSPIEENQGKASSNSKNGIRRKSSRIIMDNVDDPNGFAYQERQERIREKRRSKSERGAESVITVPSVLAPREVPRPVHKPTFKEESTTSQLSVQAIPWGEPLPNWAPVSAASPPSQQGRPYPADTWAQPPQQQIPTPFKPASQQRPPQHQQSQQQWQPVQPSATPVYQTTSSSAPLIPLVSGRRLSSAIKESAQSIEPLVSEGSKLLASGRSARTAAAQQDSAAPAAESNITPPLYSDANGEPDNSLLIASGRKGRKQSTIGEIPKAATPSPPLTTSNEWMHNQTPTATPTTLGSWGTNPNAWNNPAQLNSVSSAWNSQTQQFTDPWNRSQAQPAQDVWISNAPQQSPTWNGTSSQSGRPTWQNQQYSPQQPNVSQSFGTPLVEKPNVNFDRRNLRPVESPAAVKKWNTTSEGGFVFSSDKRGRMLLKLKIETKNGGHQTLAVHELDDPQLLATEFCSFWDMSAFRDPLVRLITVRKTNAIRLRQPQN
ncbi:SCF ubiquitin ligase complex subunit [Nowakowskiella sp. JEL0078]|nr:SCF ubiquitin ligase complex subunit [Nowakowskiella sp. JEL0078]